MTAHAGHAPDGRGADQGVTKHTFSIPAGSAGFQLIDGVLVANVGTAGGSSLTAIHVLEGQSMERAQLGGDAGSRQELPGGRPEWSVGFERRTAGQPKCRGS